jgi:hypothetical protein
MTYPNGAPSAQPAGGSAPTPDPDGQSSKWQVILSIFKQVFSQPALLLIVLGMTAAFALAGGSVKAGPVTVNAPTGTCPPRVLTFLFVADAIALGLGCVLLIMALEGRAAKLFVAIAIVLSYVAGIHLSGGPNQYNAGPYAAPSQFDIATDQFVAVIQPSALADADGRMACLVCSINKIGAPVSWSAAWSAANTSAPPEVVEVKCPNFSSDIEPHDTLCSALVYLPKGMNTLDGQNLTTLSQVLSLPGISAPIGGIPTVPQSTDLSNPNSLAAVYKMLGAPDQKTFLTIIHPTASAGSDGKLLASVAPR